MQRHRGNYVIIEKKAGISVSLLETIDNFERARPTGDGEEATLAVRQDELVEGRVALVVVEMEDALNKMLLDDVVLPVQQALRDVE